MDSGEWIPVAIACVGVISAGVIILVLGRIYDNTHALSYYKGLGQGDPGEEEFCAYPLFAQNHVPREFILGKRRGLECQMDIPSRLRGVLQPEMTMLDLERIAPAKDSLWRDNLHVHLLKAKINPWIILKRGTVAQIITALWVAEKLEKR